MSRRAFRASVSPLEYILLSRHAAQNRTDNAPALYKFRKCNIAQLETVNSARSVQKRPRWYRTIRARVYVRIDGIDTGNANIIKKITFPCRIMDNAKWQLCETDVRTFPSNSSRLFKSAPHERAKTSRNSWEKEKFPCLWKVCRLVNDSSFNLLNYLAHAALFSVNSLPAALLHPRRIHRDPRTRRAKAEGTVRKTILVHVASSERFFADRSIEEIFWQRKDLKSQTSCRRDRSADLKLAESTEGNVIVLKFLKTRSAWYLIAYFWPDREQRWRENKGTVFHPSSETQFTASHETETTGLLKWNYWRTWQSTRRGCSSINIQVGVCQRVSYCSSGKRVRLLLFTKTGSLIFTDSVLTDCASDLSSIELPWMIWR